VWKSSWPKFFCEGYSSYESIALSSTAFITAAEKVQKMIDDRGFLLVDGKRRRGRR
jgi:hypothetical protein